MKTYKIISLITAICVLVTACENSEDEVAESVSETLQVSETTPETLITSDSQVKESVQSESASSTVTEFSEPSDEESYYPSGLSAEEKDAFDKQGFYISEGGYYFFKDYSLQEINESDTADVKIVKQIWNASRSIDWLFRTSITTNGREVEVKQISFDNTFLYLFHSPLRDGNPDYYYILSQDGDLLYTHSWQHIFFEKMYKVDKQLVFEFTEREKYGRTELFVFYNPIEDLIYEKRLLLHSDAHWGYPGKNNEEEVNNYKLSLDDFNDENIKTISLSNKSFAFYDSLYADYVSGWR